jgi:hypothetical protein
MNPREKGVAVLTGVASAFRRKDAAVVLFPLWLLAIALLLGATPHTTRGWRRLPAAS